MTKETYIEWKRDQIIGFSLIPVILLGCSYHEELANFIGVLLRMMIGCIG